MAAKFGVGIIGIQPGRSWAAMAHLPALRALSDDYEVVAVSTTRQESADAAAKEFGIPNAFDNHQALVNCPGVDIVAVNVKVPAHFEPVKAAIDAGKHVYCEWPLGNGLAEAEQLTAMLKAKGVRGVVGMQAVASPTLNYVRDLVAEGYVGKVLSTTLIGSGLSWGAFIDSPNAYNAEKKNGATVLTIPFGHTVEALCMCLGQFTEVSSLLAVRRNSFTLVPDMVEKPMDAEDQVIVAGTLEGGAVASIHYKGGMCRGTNMLWEINGTEGDLLLKGDGGHAQMFPLQLFGGRGEDKAVAPMEVPAKYIHTPELSFMAQNVAEVYKRFAADLRTGSTTCPSFEDAVRRHRMIDAIERAQATGQRQKL